MAREVKIGDKVRILKGPGFTKNEDYLIETFEVLGTVQTVDNVYSPTRGPFIRIKDLIFNKPGYHPSLPEKQDFITEFADEDGCLQTLHEPAYYFATLSDCFGIEDFVPPVHVRQDAPVVRVSTFNRRWSWL